MSEPHYRARLAAAVALAVAGGASLAGCTTTSSGVGAPSAATSASHRPSSAPTASSTSPTVIDVGTTPPGTTLRLGQPALVRYTANPTHDSLIKLTVEAIKRGKLKDLKGFQLSNTAKKSGVYYVTASVKNTGDGDLGGQPIQLYGEVGDLVVAPVIFGTTFDKCDYQSLPTPFVHGARASACVVLLAPHHGTVTAVQWRPADNSEPITWTGRH